MTKDQTHEIAGLPASKHKKTKQASKPFRKRMCMDA